MRRRFNHSLSERAELLYVPLVPKAARLMPSSPVCTCTQLNSSNFDQLLHGAELVSFALPRWAAVQGRFKGCKLEMPHPPVAVPVCLRWGWGRLAVHLHGRLRGLVAAASRLMGAHCSHEQFRLGCRFPDLCYTRWPERCVPCCFRRLVCTVVERSTRFRRTYTRPAAKKHRVKVENAKQM